MLQQQFAVQVTTLPDCDDITRFDGSHTLVFENNSNTLVFENNSNTLVF
jgi:hypothetical protein